MESLCSTFSQVSASVPKVASCHGGFHSNTLKSSRLRGPHLQAQFPSSSIGRPRTFHITCAASTSTAEKEPEKREQTVSIKDIGNSLAPSSFEVQNLLMEICDETSVAEFKLKVGDFKLHIKRDAGKLKGSSPHPVVAPPIPSKPMEESMTTAVSSLVVSQPASKPSSSPSTELLSSSVFKSGSRFGLLEAAANEGLHFVTSPKVGLFRKARVVKGKSGRSLCEEGQIVKEGQVVCYIEQLGTQQPVEAENSGEIMKILCKDGEPVGYGDPLVAIRPSFPGIK